MAGGSQRVYKARIKSTQSLKKMFRAQELIAASRIGKARARTAAAAPYAQAITRAVSAVATHTDIDHPLTREVDGAKRAAVLVVSSDRGMAGSYPASIVREAERLTQQLAAEGKEVLLYVAGRRAISYYAFRGREAVQTWTYGSERPTAEVAEEIGQALLEKFLADEAEGGVSELHVVSTQFVNMVTQRPRVVRMLPLEVVEGVVEATSTRSCRSTTSSRRRRPCSTRCCRGTWTSASTRPCSTRPRPSWPPASAPCTRPRTTPRT